MEITKTRTYKTQYIEDIICNKCYKSCKVNGSILGSQEITIYGHYDSIDLEDLTSYSFALCEACLKQLFETFAVPVLITREE